jgi:hypothetical protein
MRIQHLVGALLSAAALAACSAHDSTAPTDPDPGDPAFAASFSGDQSGSIHGFTFTQRITNGYTEVDQAGHSQSTNVVAILLASIDVNPPTVTIGPQVNIGLMGNVVPGTYHVHTAGSALGTRPEFYGSYSIINRDSSRTEFQATTGTVTITSVSPKIQGTFSFHSSRSLSWPAHLVINQVLPSAPASLDASGSFVAKVP